LERLRSQVLNITQPRGEPAGAQFDAQFRALQSPQRFGIFRSSHNLDFKIAGKCFDVQEIPIPWDLSRQAHQPTMICGTGVDIAETSRIEQSLERHGERFTKKVFTAAEIAYCDKFKNRAERYAARFAAKEAAFKALGTGWREGIRWLDVEVIHQPSGKPELVLSGRALEVARELRVTQMSISISHSDRYVVAMVIFEGDEKAQAIPA
jgi:holo-[acyl-carrier protein] synthase